MEIFSPVVSNTKSEWHDAHARVKAYLQAWGVVEPEAQARIIAKVLERATLKQWGQPAVSPTTLAMTEIRSLVEEWFAKIFAGRERPAVGGLVLMLALDASKKWPGVFLAEEVPADFQRALLERHVCAAPDLSVTSMVPQPFVNPLQEANLPAPLVELAKGLQPMAVKFFGFAWITLWMGNRHR